MFDCSSQLTVLQRLALFHPTITMQNICLAAMFFFVGTATALAGTGTHNVGLRGGRSDGLLHLSVQAQPEVVAHTLADVEDTWKTQVMKFVKCNATEGNSAECSFAEHGFSRSCVTVAKAILSASNGEKDTVIEYMNEICSQKELQGWKVERCQGFAKTILEDMTADAYDNRENLNPAGICHTFWSAMTVEDSAEEAKLAQQKQKDEVLRLEAEKAKAEAVRAEEAKRQRIVAAENAAKERRRQEAARLAAEQSAKEKRAKEAAEKRALERRKKEAERQKREAAHEAAAKAAAQASRQSAMATLKEAEHQEELVKENLQEATFETKEAPRAKLASAAAKNGSITHASPATKVPTQKLERVIAPRSHSPIVASMKALSKAGTSNATSQKKI